MPEWWAGFWAGAAVVSLAWVALSVAALVLFSRLMRARDVSDECCTEDAPEIVDATYRLLHDEEVVGDR